MKLIRPTLILNEEICKKNIFQMASKAKNNNVSFRPHFKTHQSATIGNWFKNFGITQIAVSSVRMAQYFADAGWKDILIAFPVNILEIENINQLAKNIKLSLLVDSIQSVNFLSDKLQYNVGTFIKIDTGYHRSGVPAGEINQVELLARQIQISNKLDFSGLLTHSGHTYDAANQKEIISIYNDTNEKLLLLKQQLQSIGLNPLISVGDTPSCSLVEDFKNADEIRPGNFVYYDLMQYYLGACTIDDIAVRLACPVVSINRSRNEIVIHGGAVHLSNESIKDPKGKIIYGLVSSMNKNSFGQVHPDCYVSSISQEHGIIKCSDKLLDKIQIGDIVGIIPVHSCLTANLNKTILTTDGVSIDCMR